jgi:hypothetical protein
MEIFQPLSDFYKAIEDDAKINATHISLYFALLQKWNLDQSKNTFLIIRDELMKTAKISSRHTYNKCMNELDEYGYIHYVPSLNPLSGSTVHLKFIDLASEILSKNSETRKEAYGK